MLSPKNSLSKQNNKLSVEYILLTDLEICFVFLIIIYYINNWFIQLQYWFVLVIMMKV